MKKLFVIAILTACCQISLCRAEEGGKNVVTFPVVETPKNEYHEASKIEPGAIVFPREVFFGDSVFILRTAKNVGETKCRTMSVPGMFDFQYDGRAYTFTAGGIDGKYNPMWESAFLGHADYFYPEISLEPGETGVTSGVELELPPLEDWDDPFWKAVRENLPPEGRKLTLTFSQSTGKDQQTELATVEILVKPRPAKEMETLQAWFDSVGQFSLPIERDLLYGYPVKGPRDREEIPQIPLSERQKSPPPESHEEIIEAATRTLENSRNILELNETAFRNMFIELGGKSYPVASFIRFSHRKPPRSQAPATLDEWRRLWDSFAAGSIRDELELTVLKMEYFDAYRPDDPKPQLEKREEIVRWIESQPDFMQPWWAKRTLSVAISEANPYGHDPVDKERNERGTDFLRVLHPLLDPVSRQDSRRMIPEMKAEDEKRIDDMKISRGVTEQEKAEGYRFWFHENGKLLCKGRLLAIGKSRAMIKEDYGATYMTAIDTLSEDDRQYIDERRNDPQWSPDMDDRSVRDFLDREKEHELAEIRENEAQEPPEKGKMLHVYPSTGGDVFSVTYSHDGTLLLTTGKDRTAKLWNAKTGEPVQTFRGHDSPVKSAAISPDNKYVLTGGDQDRTARIWNAMTGKEIRTLPISNWNYNQAAFMPDGKCFFTTVNPRSVTMFSVETGEKLMEFRGHDNYVRDIAVSPDGLHLLTGSNDKTVVLWDIDSGQSVWGTNLENWVTGVTFTPDGKDVIAGAGGRGIRLLDAETGKVVKNIFSNTGSQDYSLAVTPDGKELIATVFQQMIHVYSLPDGKFLRGFRAHEYTVTDVSVAPDGKRFATCGVDGSVKIWDIGTSQFETEFKPSPGSANAVVPEIMSPLINIKAAHHGAIRNVRISHDGGHILLADNRYPRVVKTSNGQEVFRMNWSGTDMQTVMEFAPDGKQVFIDHSFYETETGTLQRKYMAGNPGHYYSLAFSKDGEKFMLGDVSSRIYVWLALASERPDHVFRNQPENNLGHTGNCNIYLAFLENDTKVLAVRHAGEVFVWDIASETLTSPYSPQANSIGLVQSVVHSPDEKYIVFCHYGNKTVFLRDLKTGQLANTFIGHDGMILDAAFSPDGRFLLTGSGDKTARLWEVESGQCVKIFEGHAAAVCSVAFSSDGKRFLTGSEDGTAILWE